MTTGGGLVNQVVRVPVSLLVCPDLPASAKLVWMAAQISPDQAGPAWLCAATGLTRPTVLKAMAQVAGWDPGDPGATVPVPASLLMNRKLGVQARILYGLLLLTPGFSHPCGRFTNSELAGLAQASTKTVFRALGELVRAEWIKVEQAHRLARSHFELTFPGLSRGMTALAQAQRRLERPEFFGEALMREYLSLLVDSEDFEDDAKPGFLVNPRSGERLELDRFYPPDVAFEFNGPQHYRATARYSADEAREQRERDYVKLGICVTRGITLVTILPEDLTLIGMQRAIGEYLPRRDLTGYDLLIDYLESESHTYRGVVSNL